MCELHLNDEDEYGVDESAVGVLVPPLLGAVRHVVDAHDAGHGGREVHDVLWRGLSSHGSHSAWQEIASRFLVNLATTWRYFGQFSKETLTDSIPVPWRR